MNGFSIPLWWSSLLSSVNSLLLFLLALQFSPELPKQCSGILAVPEHTRLLLLISAEHPVPPISPGPSVLTPAAQSRIQQYDVRIEENQKCKNCDAMWNLPTWEEDCILSILQDWCLFSIDLQKIFVKFPQHPFPACVHRDFSDWASDPIPALTFCDLQHSLEGFPGAPFSCCSNHYDQSFQSSFNRILIF